jgi:hypothetical protein
MPFQAGQSGNPAGMKKGTRHKTTISVAAIVNEAAPDIVKKIVAQAKAGDPLAQRIFVQHLLPRVRFLAPLGVQLPSIAGPSDIPCAVSRAMAAAVCGEVTLADGERIVGMLDSLRAAYEACDMAAQIAEMRGQMDELKAIAHNGDGDGGTTWP